MFDFTDWVWQSILDLTCARRNTPDATCEAGGRRNT